MLCSLLAQHLNPSLNFLILVYVFFWRSGSRDPRKKSTWNWYTCRQVSREFYIFNCRASNAEFPISMAIAIDLFSIIFTHASTSAIRPNASADFTRLKLRQRQRDDGHKNTAHQTQKTLNTLQSRAGSLKRWFKGGNWMAKREGTLFGKPFKWRLKGLLAQHSH